MFLEELWVAAVGTKTRRTVVEVDRGHTGVICRYTCVVLRVTNAELIDYRRRKRSDIAELSIWEVALAWVGKPTRASGIAWTEPVGRLKPIELGEGPVIGIEVVIQPG